MCAAAYTLADRLHYDGAICFNIGTAMLPTNTAESNIELSFFGKVKKMVFGSVVAWMDQRASSKGAALAFYTLFSMAPVLLITIAIAGAVFGEKAAQGAIFNELRGLVGTSGAEAIQLLLAGAADRGKGAIATIVASLLLVVGATSVFAELKASLDEIWQVPPSKKPGIVDFIMTRFVSFGLVMVLGFLLLVSLVLSAALSQLEKYWGGVSPLMWPLTALVSYAVITILFAAIFKILPQIWLSWRDVLIGALGTAAFFMLGKYAIGVYLGNSDIVSGYGAAGSLIALLLWIYYSAQIFFFGAEFTRQYALIFGSMKDVTTEKQMKRKIAPMPETAHHDGL
jgi:membrane protein